MKIYKFRSKPWLLKGTYSVDEIEVEEKEKTYVAKGTRIKKDEIGEIDRYGIMIQTENNPKFFLEKLLQSKELELKRLDEQRANLTNYMEKIKKEISEV